MMRRFLIGFILVLLPAIGFTQSKNIKVEVKNQPLNLVFLQLRNQYDFQFSYSDNELSRYKITISKSFSSKEEAIKYLLKDLPFQLKISGEVFIIVPDKKKQEIEKKKELTQITGQIVEAGSYEPLPFSHIIINNHLMVSDVMGSFNYTASADSSFKVHISHLGYYVYDTVLYASSHHQFKLIPSTKNIPEILVQNNIIEKATMVGGDAGKMTLNNNISRFLPGQGDNSVFNLIRLLPGIQAAGEQSTDLLIWGSSEGQSLVTFDEFSIFGLKNYNDNISVVNPFLVKNIEILKGGFDARYGNRVGGIVNITGKNGNMQKPVFSFNINQTTLNGMIEVPLFKKSSLLLAYRQTYYNLYNPDDFNIFAPTRPKPNDQTKSTTLKNIDFDINVYPDDYKFRDLNLKYSYSFNNGDLFYVSMYGGGDRFGLTADTEITVDNKGNQHKIDKTPLTVSIANTEQNNQRGMSIFYGKTWNKRLTTKFIISHSDFAKQITENVKTTNTTSGNIYKKDFATTNNRALENSLRIDNLFNLLNGHQFEFGAGLFKNEVGFELNTTIRDTLLVNLNNQFNNQRGMVYVQDILPIGSRLSLKTGARLNISNNRIRLHFEPRISASYKLTESLKLNASWGRYQQFIYKIATKDQDLNYSYLWIASNENIPVLNATHWVGGLSYFKNNLTINVESYYKYTRNIIQRVFEERFEEHKPINDYYLYRGNAKTYGIDFYVKKDFKKHSIWASYTLSKALEQLAPLNESLPEYSLAPHHQLHEFKVAALMNIRDFYLSVDYVYGSGMQIIREVFADETERVAYNRADAALTYKFTPKHFAAEVGLSALNIFDTQNLKFANIKNIQLSPELGSVRVYSDAVPFTPTLFLKLVF